MFFLFNGFNSRITKPSFQLCLCIGHRTLSNCRYHHSSVINSVSRHFFIYIYFRNKITYFFPFRKIDLYLNCLHNSVFISYSLQYQPLFVLLQPFTLLSCCKYNSHLRIKQVIANILFAFAQIK
nr:MAG TPA: hypothetical protein [Caudoviricetes sp.]